MSSISAPGKIGGQTLSLEELAELLPALKEVPKSQFENWAKDSAARRVFRKGEIICEEGEFGATAFYIVSGSVDIFIASPIAHIETRASLGGFLGRSVAKMKSILSSTADFDGRRRKFIPVDASVDLDVSNPIAVLEAGELFGEATCRTFQPRSATVRAAEDCVIVEMLRVVLDMLMGTRDVPDYIKSGTRVKAPTFKGTSFKKDVDDKYRKRSLMTHLRTVPLFASVSPQFIADLTQQVELVSFHKGQIICQQGDIGDAFYLIRNGMVRVSIAMPGGDMVRTYLSRGEYFGEIGLLLQQPRSATCTALDTVDLVKISSAHFQQMLTEFPRFREEVTMISTRRMQTDQEKALTKGINLDEFLNQGLSEAQNLLLIDLDKCTRCDLCVQACADAHDGTTRLLRDGLRYDKYLVATACRSCRDPLCMTQCPVGSIRRTESLEIIIENWCIGCTKCAELCPYGNINMHPVQDTTGEGLDWSRNFASMFGLVTKEVAEDTAKAKKAGSKATTCDLCTKLSTPSCVYACPHDAAKRVDPATFFASEMPNIDAATPKTFFRRSTRTTH